MEQPSDREKGQLNIEMSVATLFHLLTLPTIVAVSVHCTNTDNTKLVTFPFSSSPAKLKEKFPTKMFWPKKSLAAYFSILKLLGLGSCAFRKRIINKLFHGRTT